MHGSIYGISGTGKTFAAARVCDGVRALGMPVMVFDPLSYKGISEDFKADFITNVKADFIDYFYSNIGHLAIFEEAGEYFTNKDKPMFTRGRHFGHINIVSSQRAQQVDKTLRDQCTTFGLVFKQAYEDAKTLAREFVYDEIVNATSQPERQCYIITRKHEKQIKTDTNEGKQEIKKMCKEIVNSAPKPTLNLLKGAGIGGSINKDFLYREKFLYDGYDN